MATLLPSGRHNRALSVPTGYRRVLRLTFRRQGTVVSVEPTSALFTQDSRRALRWDGSVTVVDPALQPVRPTSLLTPYGTTAVVELGIRLLDGVESVVPYGHYLVSGSQTRSDASGRVTTVSLTDLAQRIEGYRFESPFTVAAPTDVANVVNAVVANRIGVSPNVAPVGRSIQSSRTFGLDPETGPWSELLDVLDSFGLTAWYNRVGQIDVGAVDPTAENAIPLENILDLGTDFDVRPPNVFVVRGESLEEGVPPVQAVAMDTDPSSPTYAGVNPGDSAYGRVTRYYSSPLITTELQALQAANSILVRELGGGFSFDLTRPFDPVTDVGDAVILESPLAVDAVTVNTMGNTSLSVRSL